MFCLPSGKYCEFQENSSLQEGELLAKSNNALSKDRALTFYCIWVWRQMSDASKIIPNPQRPLQVWGMSMLVSVLCSQLSAQKIPPARLVTYYRLVDVDPVIGQMLGSP